MISTCGQRVMFSHFTIKRAKHYASNCFNCFIVCLFWSKSGKYFSKRVKVNAVIERKDSNCGGTLSDQGEAETASNLSEYTINGAMQKGIIQLKIIHE